MNYFIENKLGILRIPAKEVLRYDEPHRFYHTGEHIQKMVMSAVNQGILTDELFLAIFFHDAIYNPKCIDNEELSADLAYKYTGNNDIKQAILDTKTHKPSNKLAEDLCMLDLEVLHGTHQEQIDFEKKIFKEYQFLDYKDYKQKRLEFLFNMAVNPDLQHYVAQREVNIAVYAGSFNPFHAGHYNILQKAEKIFDKVIIAQGINPDKSNQRAELPEAVQFRQIEHYNGLLTEYINTLGYDVTLVRGLRNTTDLQYELTQYRYLQDLKPDIKVVSIFCDKEFEHISSTAIRQLDTFGVAEKYLI